MAESAIEEEVNEMTYEKPEMVWLGKAEVLVECQGGFGAEMASFYPGCFAEDE